MVQLVEKLRCKWTGDVVYQPKNIRPEKWYRVIGVNSWEYEKEKDGKNNTYPVCRLMVVNDVKRITAMSIDNICVELFDEK